MSTQLYSRVFVQILDSSLADDWQARLVFEDMLKLADLDGVVDMTRQALSRRTNVPLEVVNHGIEVLEQPDARSKDPEHEGRRIARLDSHRDWGWEILNWRKYEAIRSRADDRQKARERMRQRRAARATPPLHPPQTQTQTQTQREGNKNARGRTHPNRIEHDCKAKTCTAHAVPPALAEVLSESAAIGLSEHEAGKFFDHFSANGWRVGGKSAMKDWRAALRNWQRRAPDFDKSKSASKRRDANIYA